MGLGNEFLQKHPSTPRLGIGVWDGDGGGGGGGRVALCPPPPPKKKMPMYLHVIREIKKLAIFGQNVG